MVTGNVAIVTRMITMVTRPVTMDTDGNHDNDAIKTQIRQNECYIDG